VTRSPRAGFTLLEIAVALAILGVGVVGILRSFSAGLRLEDRASREDRVVLYARAAMDSLLFQPDVPDQSRDLPATAEGFRAHVLVRHAGPSEGIETSDLDFQPDQTLRYLQVDVVWQDGTGAKTYTLKSMRVAPENE